MRVIFTILFFTVSAISFSQKLTGIWRGTFMQRQLNTYSGEWESYVYKYEVQINQLSAKVIEGVTYSYKQKEFYGKAAFRGMFTKATKNVILKETKMLELKVAENSIPCLMTCYLDYSKEGNIEKLKGSFSSIESPGKRNCGDGTITLQRVLYSDFKKESFLTKKATPGTISPAAGKSKPVIKSNAPLAAKPKPAQGNVVVQNKTSIVKKAPTGKTSETISTTIISSLTPKTIIEDTIAREMVIKKPIEVPFVLKSRTNKLVSSVIVNEKDIIVDYYDNGEIDGDIISVYDNNKLVLDHDTLSTVPLRLHIHLDENNAYHELITVAENLGLIPPNTCLMIITAGKQRFEFPMTSDEKTNAKVVIEYRPQEGTKITAQN